MAKSNPRRPVAVVTGASSGIGRELARGLAARGYNLVLVARRAVELGRVAETLQAAYGVTCQCFPADLSSDDARERLIRQVEPDRERLDVLVNNAGFGTHGFFHETDLARELELIEVNCAAPVHLSKRVLPWMLERRKGFIMNVASVSGFTPGPVMALYHASKAFLLSFSEALWEECRGTGVVVSALCPGPVRTEFQASAGIASTARSSVATPMDAAPVAEEGLQGMFAGRRVVIPGKANRMAVVAAQILPRRRMLRTVRRIQEERRRQTIEARRRKPED